MKRFFKLLGVLLLVLLCVLVGGYFYLMNPDVQKRLVESRLEEGVRLEGVRVSLSELELKGVEYLLEDGQRLAVGELEASYSLLDYLTKGVLKTGPVRVKGVRWDSVLAGDTGARVLPEDSVATGSASDVDMERSGSVVSVTTADVEGANDAMIMDADSEVESLYDLLYSIAALDVLLDVESVELEGVYTDAAGSVFEVLIEGDGIEPGAEGVLNVELLSQFEEPQLGGLASSRMDAELTFHQRGSGGFDRFTLKSVLSGEDAVGERLLGMNQELAVEIRPDVREASLVLEVAADLPRPELLMTELESVGVLEVEGSCSVEVLDGASVLEAADLRMDAAAKRFLEVTLKQPLVLGAAQVAEGELMRVDLDELPVAWLQSWLPEGVEVGAKPVSAVVELHGWDAGALAVRFQEAVRLEDFSYTDMSGVLVEGLHLEALPEVTVTPGRVLQLELEKLIVADQYGAILEGAVDVSYALVEAESDALLDRLSGSGNLIVKLQPWMKQPVLKDLTSIMNGELALDFRLDPEAAYVLVAEADVSKLRARGLPGRSASYRVKLEARPGESMGWELAMAMASGPKSVTATSLLLSGEVDPAVSPLRFDLDLRSPLVRQSDFEVLLAAVAAPEVMVVAPAQPVPTAPVKRQQTQKPKPMTVFTPRIEPPAWSAVDGHLDLQVDRLMLDSGMRVDALAGQLKVSEPLLHVQQLKAQMAEGSFEGRVAVAFDAGQPDPYQLDGRVEVESVRLSRLLRNQLEPLPLDGEFDGTVVVESAADSLERAIDVAEIELDVHGRNGRLTGLQLTGMAATLTGVGSIISELSGDDRAQAVSRSLQYFTNIGYSDLNLSVRRGADQRMTIPELSVVGDYLLLQASGSVAASGLADVLNQPMDLDLAIGARGALLEYFTTLDLIDPSDLTVNPQGDFGMWKAPISLGGSLNNPDTSSLRDVIFDAGKSFFKSDAGKAEGTEKKASPEAEIINEIEAGLNLLNNLFGQ